MASAPIFADPPIVHLSPPQISYESVEKCYVCTRPAREKKFNISCEEKEKKTVVHCYGFGGSGWTCLFGSVEKAIEVFAATNPRKETLIRVVGSGCMGLTCAIELSRLGYNVTGITTKELYNNASWHAGGLFFFAHLKESPEEQEEINAIVARSFRAYQDVSTGKHPYLSPGDARFLPVYFLKDAGKGFIFLEKTGLIPPREEVTLDFGNGAIHTGYAVSSTFYIDPARTMHDLLSEVKRRQIPIEIRSVHSFHEFAEEVIFNCTGLGSLELNADPTLFPVYGHLIALNAKAGAEHMDFLLGTSVEQNGKMESLYLFPKTRYVTEENPEGIETFGVLGGTFIPPQKPFENEEEYTKLLERAALFFHPIHE